MNILPDTGNAAPKGFDITDFVERFASSCQGKDVREVLADLIDREPAVSVGIEDTREGIDVARLKASGYFLGPQGELFRVKESRGALVKVKIANFQAFIAEEITEDNGLERTVSYVIGGKLQGRELPRLHVPASSFESLRWISRWGSGAILEPGPSVKETARHAIQVGSTNPKLTTVYTHTGWRCVEGEWVYLTALGGIGAGNVSVRLPLELQKYAIPLHPDEEREAILTSLSFLELGKKEIVLPLYTVTFLSVLTTVLPMMPNFSLYVYGSTGVFKTTLLLLAMCHFGEFRSIDRLSNFEDTSNAVEKRAFTLKDILHVLDDYHPSARKMESQQKENLAQRMVRSYSNRTGRGRLNADTSERGRYEPRGMLAITGEELVTLPSTLSRLNVVELEKGDIDKAKLTILQRESPRLPHAMSSFIRWVPEHLDEIKESFEKGFPAYRDKASETSLHNKLPDQVAFLQFTVDIMVSWLVDKHLLTEEEAGQFSRMAWDIFTIQAKRQSERIASDDPVKRFLEVLGSLISQGKVCLQPKECGAGLIGGERGDLIGFYDEAFFYLLPTPLWHAVQHYTLREGSHFPFSKTTLYRMLRQQGHLYTKDTHHTASVRIRGEVKKVLKMYRTAICETEVTEVTE